MYPFLFPFIYIIIGLLVLLFDCGRVNKKTYATIFNIVYVVLAFLVAFRYRVGNDTASYMDFFDIMPTLDQLSLETFIIVRAQPLFTLFIVGCKSLVNDFLLVQLIQAFLFFHSFYLLLRKLEIRKFYVLFLFLGYVYMAEMAALRECLGLSFCFYALLFYLDKKWIKYYLLITVGFMFHSGMIIFYLVPVVKLLKKLSLRNVILVVVVTLLIPMIYIKFAELGIEIGDNSINRYSDNSDVTGLGLSTLIYTFVLLCFFIYFTIIKKSEGLADFIYLGGVFFVLLELVGSISLPILYRYSAHFSIFFYYAVSNMLKNTHGRPMITAIIFAWLAYPPLAKFSASMKESAAIYCSVFSDDSSKLEMKKATATTDYGDAFK